MRWFVDWPRTLLASGLSLVLIVMILIAWSIAAIHAREKEVGLKMVAQAGNGTMGRLKPTGVFIEREGIKLLGDRVAHPGSYSSRRFGQLAEHVAHDLAHANEWIAAYSGCDIETYLYAFSYEPRKGSNEATLRADLHLGPAAEAPAGAGVVAARLALYAALAKGGAPMPANAPDPQRAAALAKMILLGWADHGFRTERGDFRSKVVQFCNADGKTDPGSMTAVGLQVSRGVVYSVHAQDLLMSVGALDGDEIQRLNAFHLAMFDLIRNAMNYRFVDHPDWECNHYSNHVGSQLTGLLAVARLLDDKARFDAVLNGGNPAIFVAIPWTTYFDHAIYGKGETPSACYANTGPSGPTSHPFYQTQAVEPGEIDDRYRNATDLQGIGYPMATLEWLYDSALILHNAGYDAYGHRGAHGQSIQAATRYYACFAKGAGFAKVVTAKNSGACPDFAQYDGKIVNGVDRNIMRGAKYFPDDRSITDLEEQAKQSAASGPFALDAILFGQWRD